MSTIAQTNLPPIRNWTVANVRIFVQNRSKGVINGRRERQNKKGVRERTSWPHYSLSSQSQRRVHSLYYFGYVVFKDILFSLFAYKVMARNFYSCHPHKYTHTHNNNPESLTAARKKTSSSNNNSLSWLLYNNNVISRKRRIQRKKRAQAPEKKHAASSKLWLLQSVVILIDLPELWNFHLCNSKQANSKYSEFRPRQATEIRKSEIFNSSFF